MDSAVDSSKIAADTIVAADVAADAIGTSELDETANFNLTGTSGSVGGVLFTNLVDKSASETVTGAWNLGPFTSTGVYNLAGTSGSVGGILNTDLVDKSAAESVTGAWNIANTSNTYLGNLVTSATADVNTLSGTILKTTQFASSGTESGYFIGQFAFPAASTSTVVLNSVVGATSKVFLTYTSDPTVRYYNACTAGSFTCTASSAPGTSSTIDYMVVTPA